MLLTQFSLLRRAPAFRQLFIARLVSELGNWLAVVVLTVVVYDLTKSPLWVSALLLAEFVPGSFAGLLLGPLVDRLPRRRLLVVSDTINAGVFLCLPFVSSPTILVALALVSGLAGSLFRPAVFAGMPNLVDKVDLPLANSLLSLSETGANLAGPVLAGVLLSLVGADPVFLLNALSFLVSAYFVLRIPAPALQTKIARSRGNWGDIADGLRLIVQTRALVAMAVTWSVGCVAFAGVNVSEVIFVKGELGAGNIGFGLLLAAWGLGMALGSLTSGPLIGRFGVRYTYPTFLAVMGIAILAASVSPSLVLVIAFSVLAGLANIGALVGNQTLLQSRTPDELRGRVFASVGSLMHISTGLGMLLAGPLIAATSARLAWTVAGGILVAVAVAAHLWLPLEELEEPEEGSALVAEEGDGAALALDPS